MPTPSNTNMRAADRFEFDEVGFARAVAEFKAGLKPIHRGPQKKIDCVSFDVETERRDYWSYEGERDGNSI